MLDSVIPTGSLGLDIALGIGGIPRGQIVEIAGDEGCGKTTLCLHIVAEAQRQGGTCAFIDSDGSLDPQYALHCGVDPDRLYVAKPEHAQSALIILDTLVRSGEFPVVVLDSIAALVSQEELAADLGEELSKRSDELISLTLRNLSNEIKSTKSTVIFTNRIKYGMSTIYHGLSENPARLALKMHTGIRLTLRHLDYIRQEGEFLGIHIQIQVIKNKFASQLNTSELDIYYNNGIIKASEVLDLGCRLGIIGDDGSVYVFRNIDLGKTREEVIDFLKDHPSVCEEIERFIRQLDMRTNQ